MTTTTLPDLNELAKEIHQTAVDHGWWSIDDGKRDFDEMCFLITTELAEAFEEYREQKPLVYYGEPKLRQDGKAEEDFMGNWKPSSFVSKPEGVVVELADAVIRVLDTVVSITTDDLNVIVNRYWSYDGGRMPERVGKAMRMIDKVVNKAADAYKEGRVDVTIHRLLIVAMMCFEMATEMGCGDFWSVVREKMAFNDTRPYLHGGKLA